MAEVSIPVCETVSLAIEPPDVENVGQLVTSAKNTSKNNPRTLNKGDYSNLFTFVIMLIGIALSSTSTSAFSKYILSLGLFGFAGGITNWLAVKMLFDRIPFLYGSGVIPRQFIAIRTNVKDTIMATFFDESYLTRYLNERASALASSVDLSSMIRNKVNDPSFDSNLAKKLNELAAKPEGAMITMLAGMFGSVELMIPQLKPIIVSLGEAIVSELTSTSFDITQFITIEKIKQELDSLMEEKLQELTPEIVKLLLEQVIREHLSWLVIWGNVFGGLIGLVSTAAGYGHEK